MDNKRSLPVVDIVILFLAFLLANLRALVFSSLFPDPHVFPGAAWLEIAWWIFTVLMMARILRRLNRVDDFGIIWRRNWPLGLFVFFALISVFWSLDFYTTLFRALELLLATLVASYIGMRFRPIQFSAFLFWFGAILLILTLETVFVFPGAGRMFQPPYNGAWRGIYWHKNHLGSIVALLNIVFFMRMIVAVENRRKESVLEGLFYILSLIVLYFTNSATGYILAVILHFFVICIWIWLQVSRYLTWWHYSFILGIFAAGMILILLNLDVVFGVLNRSSTMTGRVDLWIYLLKAVIPQRLWWGYGFGSVWTIESFRIAAEQGAGWGYQPVIADNGYLDIFLHVGMVGWLMFLGVLVLAVIRSFKYAIHKRKFMDFLPLLLIFYGLWANIAFSLFAETEMFVWSLIVIALFMATCSIKEIQGGL